MLNYETLLSSYDDKLTLMQWLKKVEDALKNASAVSFNVNNRGNATISFSIVFEDGSEIESGEIVLEQGESVASAAIVNGHLILTLTNGDELDAGDLGAVSSFSINGSQHLIVTYQDGSTQDLGAIFTGNVNIAGNLTANSIIENMDAATWRAIMQTPANITLVGDYVGMVKNGNKVTFSGFFEVTRTGTTPGYAYFVEFKPAAEVGAKIVPFALGSLTNCVDAKIINAFSDRTQYKSLPCLLTKSSNTIFFLLVYGIEDLTLNTTYFMRYEVTFLLSDSLVP